MGSRAQGTESGLDGALVAVPRLPPPPDEATALVVESSRAHGLGTTVLAIVRHGTLRRGSHFICGSVSGRIRELGLVEGGSGRSGVTGAIRRVESATCGSPVRLVIGWDRLSNGGAFEVGDTLRAQWPREAARELAQYRQAVDGFLSTRVVDDEVGEVIEVGVAIGKAGKAIGEAIGEAAAAAEATIAVAMEEAEAAGAATTTGVVDARERRDSAASGEVEGKGWGRRRALDKPVGPRTRAQELGVATGAAAILKAQSAGELQGMLDFLRSRRTGDRLIVLSYGVGPPREEEMLLAKEALAQAVPCAIYTLNVRVPTERRQRARALGVSIREHDVFDELLGEMLDAAQIAPPKRELAAMADDGSRAPIKRDRALSADHPARHPLKLKGSA